MVQLSPEVSSISKPLFVEVDYPNYFSAEYLGFPQRVFSGSRIRVSGFPVDLLLESTPLKLEKHRVGTEETIYPIKVREDYLVYEIPKDFPSDTYTLSLIVSSGEVYMTEIDVTKEEEQDSLEVSDEEIFFSPIEATRSSAVLYDSSLNCEEACSLESVLAGHPENSELLIAGNGQNSKIYVSLDGGLDWMPMQLDGITSLDPKAIITSDEKIIFASLVREDHPMSERSLTTVKIFAGEFVDSLLGGNLLDEITTNIPLSISLWHDFPKIAYYELNNKLYIFATHNDINNGWGNYFYEGSMSGSFNEHILNYREEALRSGFDLDVVSTAYDAEIDAYGNIYASFIGRRSDEGHGEYGIYIIKISSNNLDDEMFNFEVFEVVGFQRILASARTSLESDRFWQVWNGPAIAIDKSNGDNRGRIYVLWSAAENVIEDLEFETRLYGENFDVFLAYSDDMGETWNVPMKINDDTGSGDQVFPDISVDNSGITHISFFDRRENPDLAQYDVYYAKFLNGELSRNEKVNDIPITGIGGRRPGDYFDHIVGYSNKAYISYPCEEQLNDLCITAIDPRRVFQRGEFLRGDSNSDGLVDLSDAIYILNYLFNGGPAFACYDAADVDDNGAVDMSDAVYLFTFLFRNGETIFEPFPEHGFDSREDSLFC